MIDSVDSMDEKIMANSEFIEAIPGHLLPDRASQARLPRLMNCVKQISKIQDA